MKPGLITLMALWLALSAASPAFAAAATSASARAPRTPPDIPLPELPLLPPIERAAPSAGAVRDLETRISQLLEMEVADPLSEPDLAFLRSDTDVAVVAAAAQRMTELKDRIDGPAAERQLERARNKGRDAIRALRKKTKAKKDDAPDGDWLVFLLTLKDRGDVWRDAVELYGMLRMLENAGSTAAVREMIASYAYFGELVRIDVQRAFGRMGDKPVPALLEATKHDAIKVRGWARRQLDALGKVTPGEIVSTTDMQVVADALRALGRIRDVEATRVVMSFANSERIDLRQAAREAIAGLGEPAKWHIEDAYKSLSGSSAPKEWDWKRTAREVFRLHDRARMATVYDAWERGRTALSEERYDDAVEAFDQVLARVPLFEQRALMAPAYLSKGEALANKGDLDGAMVLLRKALRLTPADAKSAGIESRLMTLESRALERRGTPDRYLLERALKLDPTNAEAKKMLEELDERAQGRQSEWKRWLAASGVGLSGIALAILLVRRPRRPKKDAPPPPKDQQPTSDEPPRESA